MKKTKLFITAPLLLTPLATMLPLVTSCNKKTADIIVSSDFASKVDVEAISETFEVGEMYFIRLSIKQELIGKEFLPLSLTQVKTGDTVLTNGEYSSNSLLDYYTYTPYDNNTEAVLFIRLVRGSISIEAKTSALKSVEATAVDITGSGVAEFEVGEYLTTYSTRVLAYATLENNDTFLLDRDSYSITLKNGPKLGEQFTSVQSQSTGTVEYSGLTSNTFNYKVIEATQAYLTYVLLTTTKVTKYTSIPEAIKAYNDAEEYGTYTMTISSGEYDFKNETLEIIQSKGKNLTVQASYDPYYEDGELQYAVTFKHSFSENGKSLITIKANDADTAMSSIDFRGIKFDAPTTTVTSTPSNTDILLDTTNLVHDVTIKHCKFLGSSSDPSIVNAIATNEEGTAAPKTIYVGSCVGQYLNTLYTGTMAHNAASLAYDLTIVETLITDSKQLFDISGSELIVLIDDVRAYLMYEPTETTTSVSCGMSINGTGTYDFRTCSFNQLIPFAAAVTTPGFINLNLLTGSTGETKQINLYDTEFIMAEEEEHISFHTIWNTSVTDDYDWSLSLTHTSSLVENDTIYGKDDGSTKHNYWDAE